MRWLARCSTVLLFLGCGSSTPHPALLQGSGASWPEADVLFRKDPRWLGGAGAYSCDLGGQRVAWVFGDSFVAGAAGQTRKEARLIRNTVAVQSGSDPTTADMRFAWNTDGEGAPSAFFPDVEDRWHWPGACLRIPGGPLAVFLMVEKASPGGLGFAADGYRLAIIDNPDDEPGAWRVQYHHAPVLPFQPTLGVAAFIDCGYVNLLATGHGSEHRGYGARMSLSDLMSGNLADVEWWQGETWVKTDALVGEPTAILDDAGSEASFHPVTGTWIHVASRGFGATTIAIRTAPAHTGPWSDAADVFTPPESKGTKPFVYAAKAHPEIDTTDGSLAVTYATNSFTFADLLTPTGMETLYWPRFAKIRLAPVAAKTP